MSNGTCCGDNSEGRPTDDHLAALLLGKADELVGDDARRQIHDRHLAAQLLGLPGSFSPMSSQEEMGEPPPANGSWVPPRREPRGAKVWPNPAITAQRARWRRRPSRDIAWVLPLSRADRHALCAKLHVSMPPSPTSTSSRSAASI